MLMKIIAGGADPAMSHTGTQTLHDRLSDPNRVSELIYSAFGRRLTAFDCAPMVALAACLQNSMNEWSQSTALDHETAKKVRSAYVSGISFLNAFVYATNESLVKLEDPANTMSVTQKNETEASLKTKQAQLLLAIQVRILKSTGFFQPILIHDLFHSKSGPIPPVFLSRSQLIDQSIQEAQSSATINHPLDNLRNHLLEEIFKSIPVSTDTTASKIENRFFLSITMSDLTRLIISESCHPLILRPAKQVADQKTPVNLPHGQT
ncbi:MAG: hypothetical protein ACI9BD_000748 [Candidatus Marinamargulisbacteria bacterium]|jgi:hypothetical protein